MENLPVEVIGNILSRLEAARDVVIASATCRKWRMAFRNHLHVLSFSSIDWPRYSELPASSLEIIITQTIFQTTGLQWLFITVDLDEFSAASVIAWLMYTRETLRVFKCNVRTSNNYNILEKCGRQKLEALILVDNSISGIEPSYQKFPCLKIINLTHVYISALDLSLLMSACPKIETLILVCPVIAMSDSQAIVELNSSSLKEVKIEGISLDKFILEADCLEKLDIKESTFDFFELIGKGCLKHLEIDEVCVIHLDIGEGEHLEVVDMSNFTIALAKLYQIVSKSAKLRKLRLWGVTFEDEDDTVDLENFALCFPRLSHLSLGYDSREGILPYTLQGPFCLENVVFLELGWTVFGELFEPWITGLLERCPKVKTLVIHGMLSEAKSRQEYNVLAQFSSSIVRLMRKYNDVDLRFKYE